MELENSQVRRSGIGPDRRFDREVPDGDLLCACRGGDQSAWKELERRHSPRLHAIARRRGLDAASAHDVVQTTWAQLVVRIDDVRDVHAVGGWLATVARHEAIRVAQRRRRMSPAVLPDRADPAALVGEVGLTDPGLVRALRRALVRLPAGDRQLVALLFAPDRLPYAEIARRVGRPIGGLGPTRARVLGKLRVLLDEELTRASRPPSCTARPGPRPASGRAA